MAISSNPSTTDPANKASQLPDQSNTPSQKTTSKVTQIGESLISWGSECWSESEGQPASSSFRHL